MSKAKAPVGAMKKAAALRKVKKALAKGEPSADAQPAGQAPVATDELAQMREYVTGLLQAKDPPSNPYVRDMLAELRKAEDTLASIIPRIQQLQQSLQQLAERRTAVSAISQQIGLQLYRWRDVDTANEKGDSDG